jgi:hypothetical protein
MDLSPENTGARPILELEQFFAGRVDGWGVTLSRGGAVQNQFCVQAEGEWIADRSTLKLTETYDFDAGHSDVLRWSIIKRSDGCYEGAEQHVIGTAHGRQNGNHFEWSYQRDALQADQRRMRLSFADHFFLMTPQLLLATALVTKFNFTAAWVFVAYQKGSRKNGRNPAK